jgi:hypothetical protein
LLIERVAIAFSTRSFTADILNLAAESGGPAQTINPLCLRSRELR